MDGTRRVSFLDVFAERPLAGNGLAVVSDADGLSEETMLAFARETKLSETTYVQSPTAEEADYRNRIWTPGEEIPFAGHPSLGTAVAVARWRGGEPAGFVQETGAGLQPVEVRPDGDVWRASMLQAEAEHGPEVDVAAAMAAVGLEAAEAHPELPPQVVSTGLPHLIVPVAKGEAVSRAEPDYDAIVELMAPLGTVNLYLCWPEPGRGVARARCFTDEPAIGEDPATGSAAGPLCAYLAERTGADRLTVAQGEEMGRPSLLEAEMEDGRARVSGTVIPLIDGDVALPSA